MSTAPKALYLIVSREKQGGLSEQSLTAAAKAAGLEVKLLISDDTALDDIAGMKFDGNDLLYRVSVNAHSSAIESALLTLHAHNLTGVYQPRPRLGPTRRYAETIEQLAAGLPIIPTSFVDASWRAASDEQLQHKVDMLGGFPVLFKTLGLAHGQGVQKLDTLAALRTQITQVLERGGEALLREYLPEYRHFRIVVVDSQPVAAIEYHKPADDFRTNAAETPNVSGVAVSDLDPNILDIAVRSVALAGSIIGGVDILVDTTKQVPYLAEVNVPCNFSRAEGPTGVNIGQSIVQALLRKAQA